MHEQPTRHPNGRIYTRRPPEERFWAKVLIAGPDDCWIWTGRTSNCGYGNFGSQRDAVGTVSAHRYAYELTVGPIPEGMVIDHLCRNRLCVNPSHLESVTYAENSRRGRGAKLTAADAVAIRARRHVKQQQLADEYGVSRAAIGDVLTGTTWKVS